MSQWAALLAALLTLMAVIMYFRFVWDNVSAETLLREVAKREQLMSAKETYHFNYLAQKASAQSNVLKFLEKAVKEVLTINQGHSDITTQLSKKRVPISLLYPCGERDIPRLKQVLKSISQQTVLPNETILAISIKDDVSQPLDWEFFGTYGIPNLRIIVRGGAQSAGSNRQHLINSANSEIFSFCDCDDYIVPQRTEILYELFLKYPYVEAMIHTFSSMSRAKDDHYDIDPETVKVKKEEVDKWRPIPFEELWNHHSVANYSSKPWVLNDPNSEPNHPEIDTASWWFPSGFNYPFKMQPHNAWLTIRAATARSVPYPNLSQGEDSLYNWRLLKSHKNWTCLDVPLGVYLQAAE